MNLLSAVLATLTLAFGGAGLLRWLWPAVTEIPHSARLALGFCTGSAVVTGLSVAAYGCGLPFSRLLILGPVLLLAVPGAVVLCRGGFRRLRFDLAVFLGAVLVLLALAISWSRPVYGYDALSMWALKAKMMFFARTWPPPLFDRFTTHHPEYPPLVPAVQDFVYLWLGRFDDVAVRTVFAAFFASGAAILWWWTGLGRIRDRGTWLLWWCALPVLMEQVRITYADLPLAVMLLIFFGAVLQWWREPHENHWLRLAGLFGGVAFWVKQDALIGVGAGYLALATVAVWRRRMVGGTAGRSAASVGLALAMTAAVAAPWRLVVWWKGLPSDFAWFQESWLDRASLILRELARAAFLEDGYAFFWPVALLTLAFGWRRLARSENLWLALSLLFGAAIVGVAYLCSTLELAAQLATSADRVLISLFVPALLLVARLWPASPVLWRSRRWHGAAAAAAVLLVAACFWNGLHRKSDEELWGITISPIPVALTWIWIATAAITAARFLFPLRRIRPGLIWRVGRFAVTVAVFGLATVTVGLHARETGELHRRFGGRTLSEQHSITLDPVVRQELAAALQKFPAGTHVRLTPKRSRRYHQFYYEATPHLVVDDRAEQTVNLGPGPQGN